MRKGEKDKIYIRLNKSIWIAKNRKREESQMIEVNFISFEFSNISRRQVDPRRWKHPGQDPRRRPELRIQILCSVLGSRV